MTRKNISAPTRRPSSAGHWWRALATAVTVIIVCLGATEIAQRIWLPDIDDATRHVVHLVRGAFCSVLVAVAVCWVLLRNSPDLLSPAPIDAEWTKYSEVARERLHNYARWFITMRWIAVMLASFLVFVSLQLFEWLPQEAQWPLVSTVATLAGLNVAYTICLRWPGTDHMVLQLQVYLDLLILMVLLHFSGGIENQLSMMAIFHVVIGGILFSGRQCYRIAATASGLIALLAWSEWARVLGHYELKLFPHDADNGDVLHAAYDSLYAMSWTTLQAVVLFLTAYFVATLAERLREHEQRLRAMAERAVAGQQLLEQAMETAGAGLRVLNPELKIHWANLRWQRWFIGQDGRAAEWAKLEGPDSPAAKTLADGDVRVTEIACDGLPGATGLAAKDSVFQITTAPLRGPDGDVTRVVELAQDITPQKRAQAQMLRAGQLAAVGELAGQVAHEVNNPIAILSAKARLLLTDHREEMSPKVAQELGKITDLSNRVARIAQGLLSYCRPSPATRVQLDVRQPIRKSLAMVEQHARKIGVVVQDDLPGELPAVDANAQELEQVFLNLFLNAFDAMPRGGRLKVGAATTALPDGKPGVAVTVEDTGTGIPALIRERIFEPFFTTKQEGRGTGLGLSICLGLVRSHGGEIALESEQGRGSRFTIKLPVEAAVQKEQLHG